MKKFFYVLLPLLVLVGTGLFVYFNPVVDAPSSTPGPISTGQLASSSSQSANQDSMNFSQQLVSQEYHVTYGDKDLYGVLTAPDNYKSLNLPLLVIAHGYNDISDTYASYAEHIAALGYLVYRFDFYGGSNQSKSGGSLTDMSVKTELEDLSQVLNQLKGESFVDANNIQLLGISQGGLVSMLYAADHPEGIQKLVFLFPAFSIPAFMRNAMKLLNVSSVEELPDVVSFGSMQIGKQYVKDAIAIDAWAQVDKVKVPVLLIHGTADSVVSYSVSEQAVSRFANARLVPVEGADHGTTPTFDQVAFPAIDLFLKRR